MLWMALGAVLVIGSVTTLLLVVRRPFRSRDFGSVSHQWVADHSVDPGHDAS